MIKGPGAAQTCSVQVTGTGSKSKRPSVCGQVICCLTAGAACFTMSMTCKNTQRYSLWTSKRQWISKGVHEVHQAHTQGRCQATDLTDSMHSSLGISSGLMHMLRGHTRSADRSPRAAPPFILLSLVHNRASHQSGIVYLFASQSLEIAEYV